MNRKAKWLIALFAIMILSFIVSGFFFLKSGLLNLTTGEVNQELVLELENASINYNTMFSSYSGEVVEVKKEYSFSLDEVQSINISSSAADISIVEVDQESLGVFLGGYYLSSEYLEEPEVISESEEGVLNLRITEAEKVYRLGSSRLDLLIYVPLNYSEKIDLKTLSGDIKIEGLILKDVNLKTLSGNINLENLDSNSLKAKTSSGNIRVENLASDENYFETISGNIKTENTNIDFAKTTSGKIAANLFERDSRFETISGNLDLDYIESNLGIKMYSISGKLRGMSKRDGYPTITIKTVSGNAFLSRGN